MKVVVIAPEELRIPPTQGGSVQIYLHELLQSLRSINTSYPLSTVLISPDKTKLSQFRTGSDGNAKRSHYTICAKDKKDYQRQVMLILNRLQPDVIQVDNRPQFAIEIKSEMKPPVVLNLHSTTFLGPRHLQSNQAAQGLKNIDRVVLNSHYLRRAVARKFSIAHNEWNPRVIYPGIDLVKYKVQEKSINGFSKRMPLRLLFVGRVIEQKGIHVLIRAIRQLNDNGYPVRLTIVGKTPPWERTYERRVKRLAQGYPIDWAGFIAPPNLRQYYAAHHLFVCPSQYDEAFGLVNLEAMACGLPVIGSAVGGIPEIIDKSSGVLVERPQQAKSFYTAILSFVHHPRRIAMMSGQARKRAEKFTWNRTAHSFANLYQQVGRSR